MLAQLNKLLRPIRVQLANLVARAVVQLVNDAHKMQSLQLSVLDGETRDACERFQEYGFTSVPLAGSEAVVLFVGGQRDHGLIVSVDDRRYRKKGLQEGEVCVYHKDGAFILMKADGTIEVSPKSGQNVVLAGGSDFVALAALVDSRIAAIRTAFNNHVHTDSAEGSTTAPVIALSSQATVAATKTKAT